MFEFAGRFARRSDAVVRPLLRQLGSAARASADFLVPPICLACRKPLGEHNQICPDCWRGIEFIRPPVCERLGIPLPFDTGEPAVSAAALAAPPTYDRARAVASYGGAMRDLIHALKYSDRHDGRRLFGRWLALAAAPLAPDVDVVMPVPLSRWRLLSRRFNQSGLLAEELGRHLTLPVDTLTLARVRRTRSQVGLTPAQRRRNVSGAFKLVPRRKDRVRDRRVLLVDDVITTGATVEACAATLKRAGASGVDVAALARVLDPITPTV